MARKKRRSPKEWMALIGEQPGSDLSVTDFCRGKSIGLTSFYHWRQQLQGTWAKAERDVGAREKGSFVEIGQIASRGSSALGGALPWVVTLDLGEGLKLTLERERG